jgi:hypothetical protein
MIPALGLMIGCYIISRMIEMISSDKKTVVKVFSCVTILVTLVSMVDILNAGTRVAGLSG